MSASTAVIRVYPVRHRDVTKSVASTGPSDPIRKAAPARKAAPHAERRVVTYGTHYRAAGGRELSAASRIAFPALAELQGAIAAAGLAVERWMGDWAGGPLVPGSPELIPLGRLS